MRVRANINLNWIQRGTETEAEDSAEMRGLIDAGYLTLVDDAAPPPPVEDTEPEPLESMSKVELLELAESYGIEVFESWNKAEIIEEIENADTDVG